MNCGDGDLREARDWVEYCNGTTDTALVRLRAAHGYPEPHRIRYWGIGNEVDGAWQIGAKSADGVRPRLPRVREGHALDGSDDPADRFGDVAIGTATSSSGPQLLIEEAGDLIDYLSIHWYVGDKDGDLGRLSRDVGADRGPAERLRRARCGG